ncbi:MAG: S1C family serine protease [Lachnospiraceae bacterium]|nr:S1C family serine protease [Lachnospiraceae bacterium]
MKDEKNENLESQNKNASSEAASDFEFLQEKIKERPINKKKLLRRTLITASMAVLFGLLACLSFLLLEPVLNNWLYPEEEPEIVTFPQEQNEMLPEDMLTEGTTASTEEIEKDATEVAVSEPQTKDAASEDIAIGYPSHQENAEADGAIGREEHSKDSVLGDEGAYVGGAYEGDLEQETVPIESLRPYQAQYAELYKIYSKVESSMVTVTAVHSEVDWFNNTYQSEGTTAGVIIANNNRELLILSKKSSLNDAELIRVSFCDGSDAEAVIKQYDQNTDLAVLAVDLKNITSETLASVTVVTLGSSVSSGITGTPIIAIGNLFGYKDTVCYGMITSRGNVITMADSEYKLMTTDIYAGTNPSGILVNMNGEVIGIIDNSHNNDDTRNLLSAVEITELKGLITKLSNGEHIPYLGIYAQDISAQIRTEMGLPQGAFIVDIDMDSPAMLKGIQKGDILVQVGSQEIKSAADYMNVLRNTKADSSINIVVRRESVNAYEEMHFVLQAE